MTNVERLREPEKGPLRVISSRYVGGVKTQTSWDFGVGIALLRRLFRHVVRNGTLTLTAPDGELSTFGHGSPSISIRVTDTKTVWRLFLRPSLAAGEAYMDGTLVIEKGSIYDFLALCLANLESNGEHWVQRARRQLRKLSRPLAQYNSVSRAKANVAHHYDLSDTLYEMFLDKDRQYSCAYYASTDDTLEEAQERKKRHIAAKLMLKSGQRVLDIGSGWGGMALHLADTADVDVSGVTLSTEQFNYAQKGAVAAGVNDRVRFFLKDYRHEVSQYDRIVSVGMFEHVGAGHYDEFFCKVRDLLTHNGVALIHTIGSADGPGAGQPWLSKYIFPGGYTPGLSEVLAAVERAGLFVADIEVLRLHYAETLRAWRERFMANRARVVELYDERFCRMWEFYLAGCEAGFRHSKLVVFQIQLGKRNDSVPLTRDYMFEAERAL
jgi:cyclopropane-fatty-acyl-phospholipid synthase